MTENKQPKQWKNFNEQLEILQQRGLIVDDKEKALKYLRTIGYYRLSGYLYPFRQFNPNNPKQKLDTFIDNSHFEDVKNLYVFDKELRLLVTDALERIEIALRNNLTYLLGKYDPVAYKQSSNFDPQFVKERYLSWLAKNYQQLARSRYDQTIKHHLEHYSDFPVWVVAEVWDFGALTSLYSGLKKADRQFIATTIYGLKSDDILKKYLEGFRIIRNTAAHHGRLWNKTIPLKMSDKVLKKAPYTDWGNLPNNKPFVIFVL